MNKLNNFFFKQVSPWTLAWLRVGTGITLIMHMIGAKALLGGAKLALGFPVHMFASQAEYRLLDGFRLAYPGLSWLPVPSFAGFGLLEGVILALAIAWTLGVITRVSGPVLFLAVAYMFGLSQFFYSHSLLLFVLSLGVLTFAPTNRVLSIDKLILGFRKTPTIIYPIRLLQLLVTIIYLSILVNKFAAGWYDGQALSLLPGVLPVSGTLDMVVQLFGSYQTAAIVSMCIMLFVAIGLWHHKLRWAALAVGIVMHLIADSFLGLGTFNYQMLVLYIAFFSLAPKQCAVNFTQMQQ